MPRFVILEIFACLTRITCLWFYVTNHCYMWVIIYNGAYYFPMLGFVCLFFRKIGMEVTNDKHFCVIQFDELIEMISSRTKPPKRRRVNSVRFLNNDCNLFIHVSISTVPSMARDRKLYQRWNTSFFVVNVLVMVLISWFIEFWRKQQCDNTCLLKSA